MNDTAAAILKATAALRDGTEKLRFESPVHVTYNPLTYAWGPHEQYVRTYGNGEKSHLFLGMNPGPFGMAQTGVPFGEVDAVVNWLHIRGEVGRPEHTHPKRPVEGFGCPRSEVSGRRLWGLFAEAFGTAEKFLPSQLRGQLLSADLDGSHRSQHYAGQTAGGTARRRGRSMHGTPAFPHHHPESPHAGGGGRLRHAEAAGRRLPAPRQKLTIGTLLHPSPASPIANKLWPERPIQQLKELGIL